MIRKLNDAIEFYYEPESLQAIKVVENMLYSEKKLDVAQKILYWVSLFTTIVSLNLSLFSLVVTIGSNMVEQVKEIAVLRCIGLSKSRIARVYMYEAIILVVTGGLIGIVSGMIVGYLIILQNSLFEETYPVFIFPWQLFSAIICFGIFSSVFSALLPTFKFLRTNIATLMRGKS